MVNVNTSIIYITKLSYLKIGDTFSTHEPLAWRTKEDPIIRRFNRNRFTKFKFVVIYKNKVSLDCKVYCEGFYCGDITLVWHRPGPNYTWVNDCDVEITKKLKAAGFESCN